MVASNPLVFFLELNPYSGYLLTRPVFVVGEVKVSYLKRPYFVTVTTYQMAVILLFNEKTSLHFWWVMTWKSFELLPQKSVQKCHLSESFVPRSLEKKERCPGCKILTSVSSCYSIIKCVSSVSSMSFWSLLCLWTSVNLPLSTSSWH